MLSSSLLETKQILLTKGDKLGAFVVLMFLNDYLCPTYYWSLQSCLVYCVYLCLLITYGDIFIHLKNVFKMMCVMPPPICQKLNAFRMPFHFLAFSDM